MYDNKWFEGKNAFQDPLLCLNKVQQAFYDLNLTISPLDRSINGRIYKGDFHGNVTYQYSLLANNSNNNHIL